MFDASYSQAVQNNDQTHAQHVRMPWHWFAAALDELDYGVLLLINGAEVVHINSAAKTDLHAAHPLQLQGKNLRARLDFDQTRFQKSIDMASRRGLRCMLVLGKEPRRMAVSIVALGMNDDGGGQAVLVLLGKSTLCEPLSMDGFSRTCGLTAAEAKVLQALCNGADAAEIAAQFNVAISTIRTHIGKLRLKTGAPNIRALVQQIAALPPLRGILGRSIY